VCVCVCVCHDSLLLFEVQSLVVVLEEARIVLKITKLLLFVFALVDLGEKVDGKQEQRGGNKEHRTHTLACSRTHTHTHTHTINESSLSM